LDENDKMSKKNVIVANAFAIFTREGDDEMYYICRNNNSRGPLQVRNIINKVKVDVPIPPEFLKDLKLASRPLGDNKTRVSAILKGGGCAIVDVEGPILYKDFPDWFKIVYTTKDILPLYSLLWINLFYVCSYIFFVVLYLS
jgi:hypothetical protein